MIWLLKFLVFGHVHKWKHIERVRITVAGGITVGDRFMRECETCGVVRKFDCC